mmetsp:Transcript_116669/g.291290  ORF Transcript_116669/g.291290 Transcript_116669/m.291290 type:complete len:311 (-) Transcript_116669:131-1063(-)
MSCSFLRLCFSSSSILSAFIPRSLAGSLNSSSSGRSITSSFLSSSCCTTIGIPIWSCCSFFSASSCLFGCSSLLLPIPSSCTFSSATSGFFCPTELMPFPCCCRPTSACCLEPPPSLAMAVVPTTRAGGSNLGSAHSASCTVSGLSPTLSGLSPTLLVWAVGSPSALFTSSAAVAAGVSPFGGTAEANATCNPEDKSVSSASCLTSAKGNAAIMVVASSAERHSNVARRASRRARSASSSSSPSLSCEVVFNDNHETTASRFSAAISFNVMSRLSTSMDSSNSDASTGGKPSSIFAASGGSKHPSVANLA